MEHVEEFLSELQIQNPQLRLLDRAVQIFVLSDEVLDMDAMTDERARGICVGIATRLEHPFDEIEHEDEVDLCLAALA